MLHLYAIPLALIGGIVIVIAATTLRARLAAAIYAASLAVMFGASALYHVRKWGASARQVLRRVDHAAIFVFIAGTYTPFCLLALPHGNILLTLAWIGAGLGILQALLWIQAPRWVSASIYLALGWMVMPYCPSMAAAIHASGVALVVSGGICFTVGAIIYACRRPDPVPHVFGYHEVFHALVVAGCALQFCVVARLVCAPLA